MFGVRLLDQCGQFTVPWVLRVELRHAQMLEHVANLGLDDVAFDELAHFRSIQHAAQKVRRFRRIKIYKEQLVVGHDNPFTSTRYGGGRYHGGAEILLLCPDHLPWREGIVSDVVDGVVRCVRHPPAIGRTTGQQLTE